MRLQQIEPENEDNFSGALVMARCTGCGFTEAIPVEYAFQGGGHSIVDVEGAVLGICSRCSSAN